MLTSITIFLQWIYTKRHKTTHTHNTRAPFIQYFTAWSIFKTPVENKRNPLGK